MKTHLHHIELSHTSAHLSGGEKALIEIIRYLNSKEDIVQTVYTSESGMKLYKEQLGTEVNSINYVVIGLQKIENIHEYLAFYLRVFQCLFHIKKFDQNVSNIIFSHEEFLPTAIYSFLLKKFNRTSKWLAFFHMKSPGVFKGFEGEYTGKLKLPSIRILRYKFEQWVFFTLSKKNVAKVITVNSCYEDYLRTKYNNLYSLKIFGGEPIHVIKKYSGITIDKSLNSPLKKYDLSFMGRFHEQKGVFEVINIILELKKLNPKISLVMIGGGVKRIEEKFFELVKEANLTENITFKGYITGDEKFSILSQSKVFIFPSYYESFGQVALEAMKCALPVVAYNLPPFEVFKKGMIKVEILNNIKFAQEIQKLLNDPIYYKKIQNEALAFSSDFSWEKTGEEVYDLILKL